ncbi:Fic family protein [Ochrobactrum sp. BTU1]|uniref:Fic family protein n=1 Tax=Ochrobactrum sp. BTU1 TaxID=2840456 RepID=UPI001C044F73|nr:Fic family protein [Ochrobactrum sp. BTU1]
MSFTLADGFTLKNLLGATSFEQLEQAEHPKLAQRLIELYEGIGPQATFDISYLQALHKHLFQDVFEWAGTLRHNVFTFADGTQASMPAMHKIGGRDFAIGNEIDRNLQSLMSDLEARNYLRGLDQKTFATQAADAFARLNSIHPFREGNGRTQREFFAALAEQAGYSLEFGVISEQRMTFVSVAAHEHGDLEPMRRMFAEIIDPGRVHALEVAQLAFERFQPAREPHVSSWDHFYMATTEPGQEYNGVFSGASGSNFMMQRSDKAIIIGNVIDLPEPRPETGARVAFTASDPRKLRVEEEQTEQPLIPAITIFKESVSKTVSRLVLANPDVKRFERMVRQDFAKCFVDHGHVADRFIDNVQQGNEVGKLLMDMEKRPQDFGELLGKTSISGRQSEARKAALDGLRLVSSSLDDYARCYTVLTANLTQQEVAFRDKMQTPIADLSAGTKSFISKMHDDETDIAKLLSSDDCRKARKEITGLLTEINERFGAFKISPTESERFNRVVATLDPVVAEHVTAQLQQIQASDTRATWQLRAISQTQGMCPSLDDGHEL